MHFIGNMVVLAFFAITLSVLLERHQERKRRQLRQRAREALTAMNERRWKQ